jgi:hypothetical protein
MQVVLQNGERRTYDAIILATGFDNTDNAPYSAFLSRDLVAKLPNEYNVVNSGVEVSHQPRLYFVGFSDFLGMPSLLSFSSSFPFFSLSNPRAHTGRLAEINRESDAITKDIKAKQYV